MNNKIYSGIYSKGPSKSTDQFLMDSDQLLAEKEISKFYLYETLAHNLMLAEEKLVPEEASYKIIAELINLIENFDKDNYLDPSLGDVHENTEKKITAKIGSDAGWIHVGRSRNDQVCTDQKLYLKTNVIEIAEKMTQLISVMIEKSDEFASTIMPGFTHMRVATPSTFGFWWQAYASQLLDELVILSNKFKVVDKSPLGAGTSYGVNWPINPESTAKLLGFKNQFINGLGEINSRGINEFHVISSLTSISLILSRMMEDLIIWSMPELNFVAIAEEFTSGSSIMPQKMNPDIAEKIRAKSGNIAGQLVNVLVSIKGTPSGYNRDSADSKIAIVKTSQNFINTIDIAISMLKTVIANPEEMKKPIKTALATKLADMISLKFKVPFRKSHEIVGLSIKNANGKVEDITLQILQNSMKEVTETNFDVDQKFLEDALNVENALKQYSYKGSPNLEKVKEINLGLKKQLSEIFSWVENEQKNIENSIINLISKSKEFLGKHF